MNPSVRFRSKIYRDPSVLIETVSPEGFTQKRVANLWTEFSAHRRDAMIANGKGPQNPTNPSWLQLSKWQKLSFLPNL